MELNKEDIQTIAHHRFNKSHQKHFYGMVFGGLILLIITMLAIQTYSPGSWQLALGVAIAIPTLLIVGLFRYSKVADKFADSLVEECEANPNLTYVPELKEEVEEAEKTT